MDYLVFLTGLFLLGAAAGCRILFRKDRLPSRWPLLAGALIALGLKGWAGILIFAFGLGDWMALVGALLGATFSAAMLGFCLSPLVHGHRLAFIFKWAAIVCVFALTFIAGATRPDSPWVAAPFIAVASAGGWRFTGFTRQWVRPHRFVGRPVAALLLAIIASVCLLPGAVETCYDVGGLGDSPARLAAMAAIGAAAACSVAFFTLLWSVIYHENAGSLSRNLLVRRKIGSTLILAAAVFTVVNGAWLAHWLGNQAGQQQTSILLSALHLGANNLDPARIAEIRGVPEDVTDRAFLSQRAKLLDIRRALPGNRFTYLLGMRGDRLVFLVDAEDPSNEESFSPPGEPIKDYPEKWLPELAGKSTFDGPDRDDWGVWFSAAVPILDPAGKVAAILGVDYPAATWLRPLAARRFAAMGVTFPVALLLIALFSIHLTSIETTRRVESLSERLSDAMTAAELDTWECFPSPFKLRLGQRISALLGWHDTAASPSLRKLWRQIHRDDRKQLFNLIRQQGSSEAEVRLRDADGRWLWFMLRGRIIQFHPDDPVRLVGTILNIDEYYRSRLEIDKQRRFAQHVMDSVPNGIAVIGAQGEITYANPAFIRLAAGDSQSLGGIQIDSLIPGLDSTPQARLGVEATLTRLNGTTIPIQVFSAPLSEFQQNSGSIITAVDLTAAKEAEQDLLRSRAEASRLALVAKRTDNAVVITDASGRIEWVNEGFTKISGYSKEEVIGKSPGSILQRPDVLDAPRLHMRESIAAGKGFDAEILNYAKSGRAYIVHIECQPLRDRHGALTGFMAIERDVTQTRRSSNLLEAVASINTTLLSRRIEPTVWGEILAALGTAAGVDRCHLFRFQPHPDHDTPAASQVATWNANTSTARLQTTGSPLENSVFHRWHREMLAGREICGLVNDFPAPEQAPLLAGGVRSLIVVPILAADQLWGFLGFDACHDDRLWESWEIAILRSAATNIGLRLAAQHESDALVLARDEARTAAIAADKANLAKSTFLATMSHEIRTPLNAVIGMASLLETTRLDPQQQDFAETILNSGNFLLELINDILDYSRIESGKIDLDSSPFTLAELCREAFDVIRHGAMGKSIELIGRLAPHLPARFVGDRARIRQILVNLLSNAVKFTPSGFVSLLVDGSLNPEGKWNLTLEINDSGIGIAPEAIHNLFRPFVQEDASTTRRFGGSGLGLAISKRLAVQMGGDISVHSTQGSGSTFTASLALPALPPDTIAPPPAVRHPQGRELRILVVDDNPLNLRIMEETLATWGLSCDTAASAPNAILQWTAAGPYDLVLTDHHMPDTDGVELTSYFRSLPDAVDTRFSLLGSEANCPAEIRALFDEVGSKPIWPTSLHGILTRLFPGTLPARATAPDPVESVPLGDLKVLIAEDNPNNQKVIRLLLRRVGIEAEIVDDGQQAVAAATANAYDIIFLDLQMPVMDGLSACRAIRALDSPVRPFIVALTANVFQEDRDAATNAGMDDYLSKPITLIRLREVLSSRRNASPSA